MLLVQTDTSNHQLNVPNRDLLNTDSVRTKTIVVGGSENGRTVRVLDIKSAASLVGIVIRILSPTTVPPMWNLHHDNNALHHQIVMKHKIIIEELVCDNFWPLIQVHAKVSNITNERGRTANIKSISEGVRLRFIVTIWIPMILLNTLHCEREIKRTIRFSTANAPAICQDAKMGRAFTTSPFIMAQRDLIKFASTSTHFRLSTMIINFHIPLVDRRSLQQAVIVTVIQALVLKVISLWT